MQRGSAFCVSNSHTWALAVAQWAGALSPHQKAVGVTSATAPM